MPQQTARQIKCTNPDRDTTGRECDIIEVLGRTGARVQNDTLPRIIKSKATRPRLDRT